MAIENTVCSDFYPRSSIVKCFRSKLFDTQMFFLKGYTSDRRQSKMLILLTNVDQK